MNDEEFKVYRDGRYKEVLKYYDVKAIGNKRGYSICSIYVLVVSIAITPILTTALIPNQLGVKIAAILAPTVAIVTGIACHFQFHENWLGYRATWDALKHELYWHDAKANVYQDAQEANSLFVERVEALIAREGYEWLQRQPAKGRDAKGSSEKGTG